MFRRKAKKVAEAGGGTEVLRKPLWDVSGTGLLYIFMMLFMGLAAVNSQANLLFGVFGLMMGVLLISGVISRLVLRKLSIRRVIPEFMVVGEQTALTYQFTNKKRFWASLSVSIYELDGCEAFTKQPFAYMLHAAPGMTAVVATEVIPKRRGVHTMERHQIATGFPFGFLKRAIVCSQKDTVVVYPALAKVNPKLISLCRSAERTGATVRPRRGGTDEFYGLKEFRQGENPRWIYWRRSARTGVMVAKEMTQVAPPRVLLMVDTFLAEDSIQSRGAVEKVIAMAASIASRALEEGLCVGLCAWSDSWSFIPSGRGKQQRRDLLTALARLPRNNSHNTRELMDRVQNLLEPGTTPILLTPSHVEFGQGENSRSGLICLTPESAKAQRWFEFGLGVDFMRCMPADQVLESSRSGEVGHV